MEGRGEGEGRESERASERASALMWVLAEQIAEAIVSKFVLACRGCACFTGGRGRRWWRRCWCAYVCDTQG